MPVDRTNTLRIRTPEGIVFSQLLASPVTRMLAWSIDLACILVMIILLSYGLMFLAWLSPDLAGAVQMIGYFVISIGYGILLEWVWRGQTIGKRVMRLRVVDAQGLRLQPSQVVIRNLLRFVDALPFVYLVGGIACLLSPRAQRLGDLAANTVVVRFPKVNEPDLDQILSGKFNSLRQHPHLVARLRQRVSPAEAALALQAILRRDAFTPEARVELFSRMAQHYSCIVNFPPDATEGITDEQYLRNIVDVLYRAQEKYANSATQHVLPA
ncbi:MAG: RDD family protein [Verrucomicrobiota bacterium]